MDGRKEGDMQALIVYESMYGNTREIAEAIAEGWGDGAVLRHVREAGAPDAAIDLVIAGGPTHIHGMTTSLSRQMTIKGAQEDGHAEIEADALDAPGLRHWLRDLPHCSGCLAAAFDTRIDRSAAVTGSAARGIAKRLHHHGYEVEWTESFFVDDAEGPLTDGELERARGWGATLRAAAVRLAAVSG
jgi:hypothetical protein